VCQGKEVAKYGVLDYPDGGIGVRFSFFTDRR